METAVPEHPAFELVSMESPPGSPPGIARALAAGVPRRLIGREYVVLDRAECLAPDGAVAFGTSGLHGRICLEPATGAVIHAPSLDDPARNAVNASLALFTTCVAVALAHFPFYDEDSNPEEWEAVAEKLRSLLARIDPTTAKHNGFWETFADDVAIGDYSTDQTPN
jgi:SUKH-4 immunity protein